MITKLTITEDEPVKLSAGIGGQKLTEVLYGSTLEWAQDKTRIAQKGVIYVYSDYAKTSDAAGAEIDVPGFKVGDGTSYLIDLPFAQGSINEEIRQHIANQKIHVSDADRERWDDESGQNLNFNISGEILTIS